LGTVQSYRPATVDRLRIQPFADEHLDDAAGLLAARHRRHREAEPLLPEITDFRAEIEREWAADGAAGVFASRGAEPVAYLIARPLRYASVGTWMLAGIAGHALDGDPETIRDVYAAAAGGWVDAGHTRHGVFVPAFDRALVDAWFRLCFGASGVLATRETAPEEPYDAGVTIRRGRPEDIDHAARLERDMSESMLPSPSFSDHPAQPPEELVEEWRGTWDDDTYVHFVAERDGKIVGNALLYRRPPDLRVPASSIDLAQASTEPSARGTGVGRALTAHLLSWAHDAGYPVMVTDWRMTNLFASRFWPRRGFRETFLRLYRSIP
jgi:GNAT superfamily N-acetyltransferase